MNPLAAASPIDLIRAGRKSRKVPLACNPIYAQSCVESGVDVLPRAGGE
jgi:hypothetical protein